MVGEIKFGTNVLFEKLYYNRYLKNIECNSSELSYRLFEGFKNRGSFSEVAQTILSKFRVRIMAQKFKIVYTSTDLTEIIYSSKNEPDLKSN